MLALSHSVVLFSLSPEARGRWRWGASRRQRRASRTGASRCTPCPRRPTPPPARPCPLSQCTGLRRHRQQPQSQERPHTFQVERSRSSTGAQQTIISSLRRMQEPRSRTALASEQHHSIVPDLSVRQAAEVASAATGAAGKQRRQQRIPVPGSLAVRGESGQVDGPLVLPGQAEARLPVEALQGLYLTIAARHRQQAAVRVPANHRVPPGVGVGLRRSQFYDVRQTLRSCKC